jgi:biotin carboxyl carrier protein
VAVLKLHAKVGGRVHELEVLHEDPHGTSAVVRMDGAEYGVDLGLVEGDTWSLLLGADSHEISLLRERDGWRVRRGGVEAFVRMEAPGRAEVPPGEDSAGPERVTAVMPGRVVRVLVEPGTEVVRDQGLLVLEAMKMENEIGSPRAGTVRVVRVAPGQAVETGALLVELD